MDAGTHRVSKIILHSNTPGEALFGRYARCRWRFTSPDSVKSIGSEDTAANVKAFVSSSSAIPPIPAAGGASTKSAERTLVLDRTADAHEQGLLLDRPTQLETLTEGCIAEITKSGYIETLWLV